jgi:hypothetical protein
MAKGVVRPPTKKKKEKKNGFWLMGGGQTTPLGWSGGGRVAKGVVWPPPKGHKKKKKKGFVLWEWPDHPLRPWGCILSLFVFLFYFKFLDLIFKI